MKRELTIGRSPDNDILIPDPSVSRKHAVLTISYDSFSVQDNDSANGTYINGRRVEGVKMLRKNDILKVGNSLVPWMNYIVNIEEEVETEIVSQKELKREEVDSEKLELPNATKANTCGIIGIILSLGLVGIILNIIALSLASSALSTYASNPNKYTEKSYKKAKAGQLLGGIGLVLFVLALLIALTANS